jgi:hypothetical protein
MHYSGLSKNANKKTDNIARFAIAYLYQAISEVAAQFA